MSPIWKRLILRVFGHSKAYKYALKEEENGQREKEAGNYSREADRSISEARVTVKIGDLRSISLQKFLVFFTFCIHYSSERFSFLVMN